MRIIKISNTKINFKIRKQALLKMARKIMTKSLIFILLINMVWNAQSCKSDDNIQKEIQDLHKKVDHQQKDETAIKNLLKEIKDLISKLETKSDSKEIIKELLKQLQGESVDSLSDLYEKLSELLAQQSTTLEDILKKLQEIIKLLKENRSFISVWNTNPKLTGYTHSADPSGQKEIKLPLVPNGSYNFTVDWGDDTSDRIIKYNDQKAKHSYKQEGTYTVTIKGELKGWSFGYPLSQDKQKWSYYGDAEKLTEIKKWGNLDFTDNGYQFYEATHMIVTATEIPKFSTSNFKAMFKSCESLTGIPGMDKWDVSGVTDMSEMFRHSKLFNEDISSWDVSNVTDMSSMFGSAEKFNQPIGSWNVSKVTNMHMLFYRAKKFNQDIGSWKVQNVTNMRAMFDEAELFDQDISSWDVSKVENMEYMFMNTVSFNQNIGSWDISKVVNMNYMFYRVKLSTKNYNALLKGFSANGAKTTKDITTIKFHGGLSKYTADYKQYRDILTTQKGWTITDGGQED